MDVFTDKLHQFFSEFGDGRKMVLSTSENDKVSSRMMSVVRCGERFFFQTDIMLRKYRQLTANPNTALCTDNIQIEGICREKGHPLDDKRFCEVFQKCFNGSYDAYTSLENERLFEFEAVYIERWIYRDGVPYIETYDMKMRKYGCDRYPGV